MHFSIYLRRREQQALTPRAPRHLLDAVVGPAVVELLVAALFNRRSMSDPGHHNVIQ